MATIYDSLNALRRGIPHTDNTSLERAIEALRLQPQFVKVTGAFTPLPGVGVVFKQDMIVGNPDGTEETFVQGEAAQIVLHQQSIWRLCHIHPDTYQPS